MWMLLSSALAVDRCGPAWMERGAACGNDSCGIVVQPGEYAIQPHCGWSHRSVALWAGLLPAEVPHPSVVHEAVLGFRFGDLGPVATLDGRVRLTDFVALGVDARWRAGERIRARVQVNVPTDAAGRHLALIARAGWDGSWTAQVELSYLEALPWSFVGYLHWRLGRADGRLSGTGEGGLVWHRGRWSAAVGGSLQPRPLQLGATATVQYSHRRWNLALDGLWGPERSVGVRIGRWHHPDAYVE